MTKIKDGEGSEPFILASDGLGAVLDKYDGMGAGLPGIGVSYNDSTKKAVSVYEQEDVMADLKTLHEWYKAGIINQDAETLGEAPKYRMCYVAQGWPLAAKTVWGPNMDKEVVVSQGGSGLHHEQRSGEGRQRGAPEQTEERAHQQGLVYDTLGP